MTSREPREVTLLQCPPAPRRTGAPPAKCVCFSLESHSLLFALGVDVLLLTCSFLLALASTLHHIPEPFSVGLTSAPLIPTPESKDLNVFIFGAPLTISNLQT